MNPFRSPIYFIFFLGFGLLVVGMGIMIMGPINFQNYGHVSAATGTILVSLPPTLAGLYWLSNKFIKLKKEKQNR